MQLSYRTTAAPSSTVTEEPSTLQAAIEDKSKLGRVILRWLRASSFRWLGFAVSIVIFAFIASKMWTAVLARSSSSSLSLTKPGH